MNKKLITAYVLSSLNVLFIAASVGFSLYTFIFVPIFVVALFFTIRGNLRGWFVWVGCICFLINFSAQNISRVNEIYHLFLVYHPFISLPIFLSSVISLFVVLLSSDTKLYTSSLLDRTPIKTTALILLVLLTYTVWPAISSLYGFKYSGTVDLVRSLYTSLLYILYISTRMILLLFALVLLMRRHNMGYFLSYLILMTVSLAWIGSTDTSDPRDLLFGFKGIVDAIIQMRITGHGLVSLFISNLFHISYVILAVIFVFNTKEIKQKTDGPRASRGRGMKEGGHKCCSAPDGDG